MGVALVPANDDQCSSGGVSKSLLPAFPPKILRKKWLKGEAVRWWRVAGGEWRFDSPFAIRNSPMFRSQVTHLSRQLNGLRKRGMGYRTLPAPPSLDGLFEVGGQGIGQLLLDGVE